MSFQEYEYQLALHCGATLAGVKVSSMVALPIEGDYSCFIWQYKKCLGHKGIEVLELARQKQRMLILCYRPKALSESLDTPEAQAILQQCGYITTGTLGELLQQLQQRLLKAPGFPHEIGLFLGYPPRDVAGFILNGGRNFLYCGMWKVYDNERDALRLCACYKECTNRLCQQLKAGAVLQEILNIAS